MKRSLKLAGRPSLKGFARARDRPPTPRYPMTYVGDCIFIKNLSHHKLQAFVSRDNGGSDHWHTLTNSFKSGRWGRSGWEVVVLRDERDTWRTGVYMHIKDVTVYVTIHAPRHPRRPYIGDCVLIRNVSGRRFQAFVSSYQGGGNGWYAVTTSFGDGRWDRAGGEGVVCRDAPDTWRRGVYVRVTDVTVYVTIKGVGDVEIEYGGEDVGVGVGVGSGRGAGLGDGDGDGGAGQRRMTEAGMTGLGSTSQKGDDESYTLYNEYQPCAKELGEQDIHRFDGWA
ncbi:hypothetical protein PLEOSDRAFT_177123 [Pleurotus ostreatus PC15]|uniref:Uncharacterized protein n=1 Tax=Pleurotus ostreatus (strain PC15) TaxID=1137138 RepID=A0A067N6S9_PLEO1|nr:hypothetical protein PLEOSDRAFT_177123 [Pleurotus ostreatus PC15]